MKGKQLPGLDHNNAPGFPDQEAAAGIEVYAHPFLQLNYISPLRFYLRTMMQHLGVP